MAAIRGAGHRRWYHRASRASKAGWPRPPPAGPRALILQRW